MESTASDTQSQFEKMSTEEALAQFGAEDTSPNARRLALSILIGSKFLPKEADHPLVAAGREQWFKQAVHSTDGTQKLLAIAECIRLGQVVKKRWVLEITTQIARAFDMSLPALSLLSETDDRLNVARACAQMERDWLPKYMADSISDPEIGINPHRFVQSTLANLFFPNN